MEGKDKIYALANLNPKPELQYLLNMSLGGEVDDLDVSEKINFS
jgi:hypothetical protein